MVGTHRDALAAQALCCCNAGLRAVPCASPLHRYNPDAPSDLYKAPRPNHEDPAHLALKTQEARGGIGGGGSGEQG